MAVSFLLILVVPLVAFAFAISAIVVAARSKNPVVRWGFGAAAVITLLALMFGSFIIFGGSLLPNQP